MKNLVLISLDEVRSDYLGCYGKRDIATPNIDKIASQGAVFHASFSCSDFTPVAMGAALTGRWPAGSGMRDPYCKLSAPTMAEVLAGRDYHCVGFSGNGLLSDSRGFSKGFHRWYEPTPATAWATTDYDGDGSQVILEGYYWPAHFLQEIQRLCASDHPFFLWGHFYETHGYSESWLESEGLIPAERDNEYGYYSEKIELADKVVVGPTIEALERGNVLDDTILVVMSDHGTNLGEHEVEPLTWRDRTIIFPQHTTLYDCDVKTALILAGPGIPVGTRFNHIVSSIDIFPTIMHYLGIDLESDDIDLDGNFLFEPEAERVIYMEDLFERRGTGAIAAVRGSDWKYVRNTTTMTEEYYDLIRDPRERNNIIRSVNVRRLFFIRRMLNDLQLARNIPIESERAMIDKTLRSMGYFHGHR